MDMGWRDARTVVLVAIRVGLLLLALFAINLTVGEAVRGLTGDLLPHDAARLRRALLMASILYALLLALPFVPGIEIGLAILAMLGTEAAPHVFAATVAGLSLAFLAGRLVPLGGLERLAAALRLRRAAALIRQLAEADREGRLALLMERAPNRFVPYLIRHRHIALAVLLNLPGNALIGGGGGIALAAGISRLISPPAFLLTVTLAVSPVPILFFFLGNGAGASP